MILTILKGFYKKYLLSKATDDIPLFNLDGYKGWAKIVNVYDGDTFRAVVYKNNRILKFTFRPIGYDAPEMKPRKDTPYRDRHIDLAHKAKNYFMELVNFDPNLEKIKYNYCTSCACCDERKINGLIFIHCQKNDKYGRVLVTIYNNPGDVVSINSLMLTSGYVLPYDGKTKSEFVFVPRETENFETIVSD